MIAASRVGSVQERNILTEIDASKEVIPHCSSYSRFMIGRSVMTKAHKCNYLRDLLTSKPCFTSANDLKAISRAVGPSPVEVSGFVIISRTDFSLKRTKDSSERFHRHSPF